MFGILIGNLGCFIGRVITDIVNEPEESQEFIDASKHPVEFTSTEDNNEIIYKSGNGIRQCIVDKTNIPFTFQFLAYQNPVGVSALDSAGTTDEALAHQIAHDFVMYKINPD